MKCRRKLEVLRKLTYWYHTWRYGKDIAEVCDTFDGRVIKERKVSQHEVRSNDKR